MIKNSGWARPINARKHHYFKEGDFESPDDCVECRKKINEQKESN